VLFLKQSTTPLSTGGMEVSGEIYVPDALPPGKEPLVSTLETIWIRIWSSVGSIYLKLRRNTRST